MPAVSVTLNQSASLAVSKKAALLPGTASVVAAVPMPMSSSSLRMRPSAEATFGARPLLSTTTREKFSSYSAVVSPATLMVMVFADSVAAKDSVPVGSAPPMKSAPFTVAPPGISATRQFTV